MAIADRFYANGRNKEFERELVGPDGEPSGLRIWVMDMQCDAAVAVDNAYSVKNTDVTLRYMKREGDVVTADTPDGMLGELVIGRVQDKYAACISRWDFNGEGIFSDDEPDPECTDENKVKVLGIPGVGDQIRAWIDEISDFTKPSKEG